ncbi:MAG: pseudouridine synthase [Candidatus Woesearchaeota archaeon]|nr:pseudouridine synthase [Candidatus Woesearchaeota archaeon]
MSKKIRLVQYLAKTGEFEEKYDAARSIQSGHISVDGKNITNPNYEIRESADVMLNGKHILPLRKIYIALNKPKRIFCQKSRDREAKTIYSFIRKKRLPLTGKEINSLFSVGRLDQDTTGLLIVTNDGKLNELMMRPERKVKKEYTASIDKEITEDALSKLRAGVTIKIDDFDGKEIDYLTKPCSAEKLPGKKLRIAISEGKKRQVKLMLSSLGYEVISLQRESIGNLTLSGLGIKKEREIKEITEKEAYGF